MMQSWFPDAKLGIFIHWGIYAVRGVSESWSFFNGQISYEDYMVQCEGFSAERYDPFAWAKLFQRVGARYAVLTAKHHDGVAMWDTCVSELSTVHRTPARRDLMAPYCQALRENGLKVGIYYSHLDWSHPDYCPLPPAERRRDTTPPAFAAWEGGENSPQWRRFLGFHHSQLEELCTRFRPDLLWFDGDWEPGDAYWRMDELRALLHLWQPGVILNSRMRGHGDYQTPEQGVPIVRPEGPWEFCVTLNDSWGYQPGDRNYKTVRQIVRMFSEVIGMGGNLLLDVAPMADGTIPAEQVQLLEGLGRWTRQHEEAVYGTEAGLPSGHFYGASTLSKDRCTLYLTLYDKPIDEVAIKGIRNTVRRVSVLGTGGEVAHRKIGGASWMDVPGVVWVTVPESELDSDATVLKVELDGPLNLYRGAGQAIESN